MEAAAVSRGHEPDESDRPWWTAVDQAELDVLVHELCRAYFQHREQCASCARGYPPCPHVGRAIDAVLEWRESRELLSKAEWARRRLERLRLQRALR